MLARVLGCGGVVALIVSGGVAVAAVLNLTMQPGDTATVTCSTGPLATPVGTSSTVLSVHCPQYTVTKTMTPTPSPTPTSVHGNVWHPPTDHEHGDAPPGWVQFSSWPLHYHGAENHRGHKGVLVDVPRPNGTLSVYMQVHIFNHPKAATVQYHTGQSWWKDTAGNVSYMQGWMDLGTFPSRRFVVQYPTPDDIPGRVSGLRDAASAAAGHGLGCETWYPHSYMGLAGWHICSGTYFYDPTDDVNDPSTWTLQPGQAWGLNRGLGINITTSPTDTIGHYCTNGHSSTPINCTLVGTPYYGIQAAYPQYRAPTLHLDFDPVGDPSGGLRNLNIDVPVRWFPHGPTHQLPN